MIIDVPEHAAAAIQTMLAALGVTNDNVHSLPDAPLVRDAVDQFLALTGENTRRTYRTHLVRFRDGIAPICDQRCDPCSTPVRTQPIDRDGNLRPGRQYAFECRCSCRACQDSRIHLAAQGDLPVGPTTVCHETLSVLAEAAIRIAVKTGIWENVRRAKKGKPPKKADGFGAKETAIAAMRSFCTANQRWVAGYDGHDIKKPTRSHDTRRALERWEMFELAQVTELGGNDPELDSLLVQFGIAVGARRLGATSLTVGQIDRQSQIILMRDKYDQTVPQPVSLEVVDLLLEHARSRGGGRCDPDSPDYDPRQHVFRRWEPAGHYWTPITSRRFDNLAERWQRDIPWASSDQLAYHHLRHTMAAELHSMPGGGPQVAKRYLRHADGDVTYRYGRCTLDFLADCLSRLLDFEHPLVHGRHTRQQEVLSRYGHLCS